MDFLLKTKRMPPPHYLYFFYVLCLLLVTDRHITIPFPIVPWEPVSHLLHFFDLSTLCDWMWPPMLQRWNAAAIQTGPCRLFQLHLLFLAAKEKHSLTNSCYCDNTSSLYSYVWISRPWETSQLLSQVITRRWQDFKVCSWTSGHKCTKYNYSNKTFRN